MSVTGRQPDVAAVLEAVRSRVSYLRASDGVPDESGWVSCATFGPSDVASVLDDAEATRPGVDRLVVASLLAQSYAFRVGAVSLAAYAVGLPWPSPAAADTSVRLAGGRAVGVAYRQADMGAADDPGGLAQALIDGHLAGFARRLRSIERIGARLVWGNVAASCAAAFRAVEGAARDRHDEAERQAIRERATALFGVNPLLQRSGRFEIVTLGGADGWYWNRTSCCLWFRVPGASPCDDCSLTAREDLSRARHAELLEACP